MAEKGPTKITLSDELEDVIQDRIENEVRKTVGEAINEEEDKRFKQFKMFVGFVGLVGLGTFGTLSNYLIEKAVESKLEMRTGNISDSLDFVRFSSVSLKLELGKSFTNEDKDAVMGYLRRAAKNEKVRHTPEFMAALYQVTEAFVSSAQSAPLDEIFVLYERETLTSNSLVSTLINHYGRELVARPSDPKDDTVLRKFEKLEAVASGARVPELPMYYRILLLHKKNPAVATDEVKRLIKRIATLQPADKKSFFLNLFLRTKEQNWREGTGPDGHIFETLSRTLFSTYADEFVAIGIDDQVLSQLALYGVDKDEMEPLTDHIMASGK